MRRILVTGGGGFVGKRLASQLLSAGDDIAYIYRSAPVAETKAAGLKLELSHADAYRKYEAELKPITHLIHTAAPVPSKRRQPSYWQDYNEQIITSLSVLGNLLENLPKLQRVILISSCYIDNPDPKLGFYGVGKQIAEEVLRRFGEVSKVSTIALRFPQLYGPGEVHGIYANKFAQQAAEGEPLVLEGGAGNKKDLLFIDDAVAAVVYALGLEGQQAITVSSERPYSILEVAEEVSRQTGVTIQEESEITETAPPLHFQSTFSKNDFSLKYPLNQGIAQTIAYYKEHHV